MGVVAGAEELVFKAQPLHEHIAVGSILLAAVDEIHKAVGGAEDGSPRVQGEGQKVLDKLAEGAQVHELFPCPNLILPIRLQTGDGHDVPRGGGIIAPLEVGADALALAPGLPDLGAGAGTLAAGEKAVLEAFSVFFIPCYLVAYLLTLGAGEVFQVKLQTEAAESRHIEAGGEGRASQGLLTGGGGDVAAPCGLGVEVAESTLNIQPLDGVGIVAGPDLGG